MTTTTMTTTNDPAQRPRVSLVMMVKNGAGTIKRTLDNVGPYIDEVCISDSGCTDNTIDIVKRWCEDNDKLFHVENCSPHALSHFYTTDSEETFKDAPWKDKTSFSNLPLLLRWDLLRLRTLNMATFPVALFLDADDLFDKPQEIPGQAQALLTRKRDVLHTTYQLMNPKGFASTELVCWRMFNLALIRELTQTVPGYNLRWVGWTHELLQGYSFPAHAPGVIVKDMRDNVGDGARIPDRALKIIWLQSQAQGIDNVDARTLYYLGAESRNLDEDFAVKHLQLYLTKGRSLEERAAVRVMLGEIAEKNGDLKTALDEYQKASYEVYVPDTLFSKARVLYVMANTIGVSETEREELLTKMIAAAKQGFANLKTMDRKIASRNPALERGTYVILSEALASLGRPSEAAFYARLGMEVFPDTAHYLKTFATEAFSL